MEQGKDKRLADLLASYGADRMRWPASARALEGNGTAEEEEQDAREIDRVLSLASAPGLPEGALARLMAKLPGEQPAGENVFAFPGAGRSPRPPRTLFRYAAALPLAASLALGIYLGARGTLDVILPSPLTGGGVALNYDPPDDLGGVGEADAYAEDAAT